LADVAGGEEGHEGDDHAEDDGSDEGPGHRQATDPTDGVVVVVGWCGGPAACDGSVQGFGAQRSSCSLWWGGLRSGGAWPGPGKGEWSGTGRSTARRRPATC